MGKFHHMKSPKECRYCGRELPPEHVGRGRQKQFCNDNCRVKLGYRRKFGVTTNYERRMRRLKKPYGIPQWSEAEKAWLAMAIDGEGSVSFIRTQKRNRTGYYYHPTVTFNNTDLRLIERFEYLAQVTTRQRIESRGNFKARYTVKVERVAMVALLQAILPYLIAKKRQAEIVIAFCEKHNQLPVRTPPLDEFESMWAEARALNKRGVS